LAVYCRRAGIEVRPSPRVHVRRREVGSRKVGSRKVGSRKVGSRKVGSRKVGSRKVGSRKVAGALGSSVRGEFAPCVGCGSHEREKQRQREQESLPASGVGATQRPLALQTPRSSQSRSSAHSWRQTLSMEQYWRAGQSELIWHWGEAQRNAVTEARTRRARSAKGARRRDTLRR
jgi:hypothetical protein